MKKELYVWGSLSEIQENIKNYEIQSVSADTINGGYRCDMVLRSKPLINEVKLKEICDCNSDTLSNEIQKLEENGWDVISRSSGSSGRGGYSTTYYQCLLQKSVGDTKTKSDFSLTDIAEYFRKNGYSETDYVCDSWDFSVEKDRIEVIKENRSIEYSYSISKKGYVRRHKSEYSSQYGQWIDCGNTELKFSIFKK